MVRLALIGTGRWGQRYVDAISALKNCTLQYICSPRVYEKKIPNNSIKVKNYKDIAKFSDVDGIIIAASVEEHFAISSFFIKHNYNLLIEKPLTDSYETALQLEKLLSNSSSIIQVSNIYHYHEAFHAIRKRIGNIGKIFFIDSIAGKDVSFKPGKSLSALWEWAPHDIAICNGLLGNMPKAVAAWSVGKQNNERMVYIRLFYPDAIQAFIKVGWLFPYKTRELSVNGTVGSLVFDNKNDTVITHHTFSGATLHYDIARKKAPLQLQVQEFVRCIQNRTSPFNDFHYGLGIVKVIHFIQRSISEKGMTVKIS